MQTLVEFIPRIKALGSREAIRWSSSVRTQTATYDELHGRIGACVRYLEDCGMKKGDRALVWAENRIEWVAFFWACVARGVHIVPVDFRFTLELVDRIRADCDAKTIIDAAILDQLANRPAMHDFALTPSAADDIVEIIYTSGTTGEPKGVVHRHRNICANLQTFEHEIAKYRRWARPFQPIRILDLLPLSHMFGQAMGLFIPIFLQGAAAFSSELHPASILRVARNNRISVIVAVPRILEVLQHEIERQGALPPAPAFRGVLGVAARWIRYHKVHSRFGWKFWAFVVGGARVDPQIEEFWSRLGFLVVQGYGLTEASPVVAVNHPFGATRGSLGKPIAGQEVRIGEDGEILVRGESIAGSVDEEGWLHTGDLGRIDNDGRLYYLGRKKDLIVTAEGLNVAPEDVERVLNQAPEVKDSAVVSIDDRVHAALILRNGQSDTDAADVVRRANEKLEAHQRIQHWSIWPYPDFPRTPSTLKTKRADVAASIRSGRIADVRQQERDPAAMSSLERVELLAELEARHGVQIDEEAFTQIRTAKELSRFINAPKEAPPAIDMTMWPLSALARAVRDVFQGVAARPLFRHYLLLTVEGLEHLREVQPPVIFAANHTSHLDTPAVFAALPRAWRNRLAPAMRAEFFSAHFEPSRFPFKDVLTSRLQYGLARLLYNCYPLPQEMAGMGRAFRSTEELLACGYCPLVFPEGRRTLDGLMQPFRPGVGLMAVRLHTPVVPVYIDGLFKVFSVHHSWPDRGPVRVTLGEALNFSPDTKFDDAALTIEKAVKDLAPDYVRLQAGAGPRGRIARRE